MSTAARFAPRYTVEDHRLWKGDWELWDGIAIAMTPSPFGRHQTVVFALVAELRAALRLQKYHATALGELDWIISHDTIVRPDAIVVCGEPPVKHLQSPPALVAEVLSASTRQNDLTYKRELYASQQVETYLIIDPDDMTVEKLELTSPGNYDRSSKSSRLTLSPCDGGTIEIEVSAIFS